MDNNEIKKIDKEIKFLEDMENSLKVKLNSCYGALGSKFSIFYDLDNAISVTTCGQNIIKHAEVEAKKYFIEKYGMSHSPVIYIDTDSLFVSYLELMKKLKLDIDGVRTHSDDLREHLNQSYNDFCHQYFNISKQYFVFKKEIIADHILFIEKKHYIVHMLENEGIPVDEEKSLKAKGMELVTSTTPEQLKPLLKDIVRNVLKGNTAEVVRIIKDGRNSVFAMPIEDIARSGGIKNIEKFIEPEVDIDVSTYPSSTDPSTIAGKRPAWKSGTPIHVKCAICYNWLTRDMRNKYDEIKSNSKMKYVYLKKNRYNWDSIGFVEKFPSEFGLEVDYSRMYDKLVMSMVEKIFEVLGWSVPNMKSINLMSIFEQQPNKPLDN